MTILIRKNRIVAFWNWCIDFHWPWIHEHFIQLLFAILATVFFSHLCGSILKSTLNVRHSNLLLPIYIYFNSYIKTSACRTSFFQLLHGLHAWDRRARQTVYSLSGKLHECNIPRVSSWQSRDVIPKKYMMHAWRLKCISLFCIYYPCRNFVYFGIGSNNII